MLDLWIKFTQRKREDPNWEPEYAQEPSPVAKVVNFVSQYAIWIVGGILLKDTVTNFMSKNAAEGSGDTLVSSALDGVHHLSNTMG